MRRIPTYVPRPMLIRLLQRAYPQGEVYWDAPMMAFKVWLTDDKHWLMFTTWMVIEQFYLRRKSQ